MPIPPKFLKYSLGFLLIHLFVCLLLIFTPPLKAGNKLIRFYKVHIMPGPFFTEHSIDHTYHTLVAWHENETWTQPINPALSDFNNFTRSYNITHLYESRHKRALTQNFIKKLNPQKPSEQTKQWKTLINFLANQVVASPLADSLEIQIVTHSYNKPDSVIFRSKQQLLK
jgi:hypothetical protein